MNQHRVSREGDATKSHLDVGEKRRDEECRWDPHHGISCDFGKDDPVICVVAECRDDRNENAKETSRKRKIVC
jgi:hypothetical protein